MPPFYPLDRFLGPCDHEPEYQLHGQCARCGMVTSLDELRRVMGAPAYHLPAGRPAPEPFRPLDRAFDGGCGHEPEYRLHGGCLRCGMIISLDEAMKAPGHSGPAPFSWPPAPGT